MKKDLIRLEKIRSKIFKFRNERVMLDFDLAELYNVETRVLKQAVRRNRERFPSDFMFELTIAEMKNLRSQNVMSSWGGRRYKVFAFTEQGVAMLSSILNSKKSITVNISIMRAFVLTRQFISDYSNLKRRIISLEKQIKRKFKDVYEALDYLFEKDLHQLKISKRKRIGFKS